MTVDADLSELAAALGHDFRRPELLADAVTHPSLSGMERVGKRGSRTPAPGLAYERLEFLGDRVLGVVIANWLLERFPAEREGFGSPSRQSGPVGDPEFRRLDLRPGALPASVHG